MHVSIAPTTLAIPEDLYDPDIAKAVRLRFATLFPAVSEDAPRGFVKQLEIAFSEL